MYYDKNAGITQFFLSLLTNPQKPRIMDIQTILSNLKIDQLNAMQEASIDAWKEGSDLILLSPTGSGKTLAYLLPLVSSLKKGVEGVQAVVLVPSRELALQIEQVFKAMATGFPVMSCYGGRPAMEEHRTMKGISPAVIIGTPGRMNDHLNKQNFEAGTRARSRSSCSIPPWNVSQYTFMECRYFPTRSTLSRWLQNTSVDSLPSVHSSL